MCDDRLRRNEVRTGRSRGRCALGTAVDGEDVILRVDAVSGDLARHPRLRRPRPSGAVAVSRSGWIGLDIAGERLRPERIDLEAGSFVGVLCYRLLHRAPEADPDDRCGYDAAQKNEPPLLRHGTSPRWHGGEEVQLSAPKEQACSKEAFPLQSSPYVLVAVCSLADRAVKSRRVAETWRNEAPSACWPTLMPLQERT